jgi:hypothetical protein
MTLSRAYYHCVDCAAGFSPRDQALGMAGTSLSPAVTRMVGLSAAIEAGCKTAIGTRLKRSGTPWTLPGADAITALRCCKLSGRFEDFWERRSAAAAGAGR